MTAIPHEPAPEDLLPPFERFEAGLRDALAVYDPQSAGQRLADADELVAAVLDVFSSCSSVLIELYARESRWPGGKAQRREVGA